MASDSEDGNPPLNTASAWKRKYQALEAQTALAESKCKSITSTQKSLGRGLRRIVDMFRSVQDIIGENDRHAELLATGEEDDFAEGDEGMIRAYNVLVKQMPVLKKLLDEQSDPELLETLYRNLRKGSDMARGDDAGNLKTAVVVWVDELFGPSDPPLKPNSKEERGLENNSTGQLLCPSDYQWEDMELRTLIRSGHPDYPVTAQSWPVFVYDGYKCDPGDIEKGLFRSPLLLKAFKHIFTSPTSAQAISIEQHDDEAPPSAKRPKKKLGPTRSHVASLIGLRKVTPRAIAYVAVQLRFSLSSATSWHPVDIDFSYEDFYNAIVDHFEVIPGPVAQARVDNLLGWWNKRVFGRPTGAPEPARQRPSGLSVATLAAQRRAREAAGGSGSS